MRQMTLSVLLANKLVLLMYGKKGKGIASLNDLTYLFATTTDKPAALTPNR